MPENYGGSQAQAFFRQQAQKGQGKYFPAPSVASPAKKAGPVWNDSQIVQTPKENRSSWGVDKEGNPTNPVTGLLDILSRPNYAVAQTVADLATDHDAASIATTPFNFIANLFDNDKRSISDLARGKTVETDNGKWTSPVDFLEANENDSTAQKILKGVGGLAADIALDPSTYIPVAGAVGAIGKAAKAAKGINAADDIADVATAGGRAVRDAEEALAPAQAAEAARGATNTPSLPRESAAGVTGPSAPYKAPEAVPMMERPKDPAEGINTVEKLSTELPAPTTSDDFLSTLFKNEAPIPHFPDETVDEVVETFEGVQNPITGKPVTNARSGKVVRADSVRGKALLEKGVESRHTPTYSDEALSGLKEGNAYLTPFEPMRPRANESTDDAAARIVESLQPQKATANPIEDAWQAHKSSNNFDAIDNLVDDVISKTPNFSPRNKTHIAAIRQAISADPRILGALKHTIEHNGVDIEKSIADWAKVAKSADAPEELRDAAADVLRSVSSGEMMRTVLKDDVPRWAQDIFDQKRSVANSVETRKPGPVLEVKGKPETPKRSGPVERPYQERSPEEQELIRQKYKDTLHQDHYEYLYNELDTGKSPFERRQEFIKRLRSVLKGRAIKTQTRYQTFNATRIAAIPRPYPTSLLKDAPTSAGEAIAQQKTAGEIVEATPTKTSQEIAQKMEKTRTIADGEDLEDFEKEILLRTVDSKPLKEGEEATGQQWTGRGEGFNWTSASGTARNAEKEGEGLGVNVEAFNAKAQSNLFRNLVMHYSAQWTKQGGNLNDFNREKFMFDNVMRSVQKTEEFLRANGIPITSGNGMHGIPVSLGDVVWALNGSEAGRSFLMRRVFNPNGRAPKGSSNMPGTVFVDGLLRAMEPVISAITNPAVVDAAREAVIKSTGRGSPKALTEALESEIVAAINKGLKSSPDDYNLMGDTFWNRLTNEGQSQISRSTGRNAGPVDVNAEGQGYYGPKSAQVVHELLGIMFGGNYKRGTGPKGELLEDWSAVTRLARVTQHRAAQAGIDFGDNVSSVSRDSIDRVLSALDNERFTSSNITQTLSPEGLKRIADEAAQNQIYLPVKQRKNVAEASSKAAKEQLADVVPATDFVRAENNAKIQSNLYDELPAGGFEKHTAGPHKKRVPSGVAVRENTNVAYKNAESERDSVKAYAEANNTGYQTDEITYGLTDKIAYETMVGLKSAGTSKLGKIVNHLQFPAFHEGLMKGATLSSGLDAAFTKELTALNRVGTRAQKVEAFNLARSMAGGESLDPVVNQLRAEFRKKMDFFSAHDPGNGSIVSSLLDNGVNIKHWIHTMNSPHYKFTDAQKFQFAPDWDELTHQQQVARFLAHLEDATVEVDDPIEYLKKMQSAASNVVRDMAFSQQAHDILRVTDTIRSTPKPGYLKINPDHMDENLIYRYFKTSGDVYIDKNLASQIENLHNHLSATTRIEGSLGEWITKNYDPIQQVWKYGMTLPRPGHHIRNLVGDISASFLMDGVKNPRSYFKSIQLLANSPLKYDSVDYLKMLQGMDVKTQAARGMRSTVKARHHGKTIEFKDSQLMDKLTQMGMFKSFAVGEDLIVATDMAEWAKKVQNLFSLPGKAKGRGTEVLGGISEARDHFVRLAHALDLIEKGKITGRWGGKPIKSNQFRNYDDFLRQVVKRVNQSHPDGSDLTNFERKWMRRVFPFYSWTRKAIPLIVESLVTKPARVTVIPKAQYNLAIQMGVEPDSLSDPWPNDQLFPSWLSDSMTGPLWRNENREYFKAEPGFVDQDILNGFFGPQALNEGLGMVSPIIKTIPELLSGQKWGFDQASGELGGPRINDQSEYIGSQIPGISQLQTLSGYDVLGSLTGPEQLDSVEKGNRGNWDTSKLLNFLLGGGVQNMSTPSTINSAEIELRNSLGN